MVTPAVSPFLDESNLPPPKVIITHVLPGGCQLRCPFCITSRRGERLERSPLTPDHHAGLVRALAKRGGLGGVAIVGDEPLQRHSWPYARAILDEAALAGVRSAMITNGMELADFLPELARTQVAETLVSLDAVGARHDAIRGRPGAFEAIRRGLAMAAECPDMSSRITLAAILMPGGEDDTRDVIRFAASLGFRRVAVSPLLMVNLGVPLRVHPKVMRAGPSALQELSEVARDAGIELFLSDDFCALDDWKAVLRAPGIAIRAPARAVNLIRVDASGGIATWNDIRRGAPPMLRLSASLDLLDTLAGQVIALAGPEYLAAA